MSNYIDRIKRLLHYLPKKDYILGEKLLQQRKLEELKDLVDSALIKVKRNMKKENPKEDLITDLDSLRQLKAEIDSYNLLVFRDYEDYAMEDYL